MLRAQIPNIISGCRLAATPLLLWFALGGHREAFTYLLLACLLSDIVDGLIARVWRCQSKLGALLDSTADAIVTVIAFVGILVYQREFVARHGQTVAVLIGLYLLEVVLALARYGRLTSFHTYLVRVSAYAQGIFIVSMFLWGYADWAFMAVFVLAAAAVAEEYILIALLPDWTHDVRGLYWVLASRRRAR